MGKTGNSLLGDETGRSQDPVYNEKLSNNLADSSNSCVSFLRDNLCNHLKNCCTNIENGYNIKAAKMLINKGIEDRTI